MEMATRRIKPFRFENLEKLNRKQIDLQAGILRYLPSALPFDLFLENLTEQLEKYVGKKVHLELSSLREPHFQKYRLSIPDPAILYVFSCIPLQQKAFLQVDFALAHMLVDRMLGGKGNFPQSLKSLSHIEEGVLQFLVLKVLTLLAETVEGNEIQFRMDSLISNASTLEQLGDDQDLVALLTIQVTVGNKAGFVRVALPHPLVEGLMSTLSPKERPLTAKEINRLEKVANVKMPIWIELGHLDINTKDLSQLESGDVVLLDKVLVELGEEGITGPVTLRVMDGVGGGFQGKVLESTERSIGVSIEKII